MKASTLLRRTAGFLALTFTLLQNAGATAIYDVTSSVTLADPTQMGRLSRNSIAQDWTGGETFPGVINASTLYHYQAFVISSALIGTGPFIQITFDSVSANTFVSAYAGSYLPNSSGSGNLGFDTNWLGDAGRSGNSFGVDPLYFQVLVPTGQDLVVVINNTAGGNVGVGDPFHLIVESFADVDYTDPVAPGVPDGGTTGLLLGVGLAGVLLVRRKAFKPARQQLQGV